MKQLYLYIFFLAIFCSSSALAQSELLSDGAYGTTIHGGVHAKETKTYSLNAKKGQILKVHASTRELGKGVTLDLFDSDGVSLLGSITSHTKIDTLNLILPKTDEYQLFLYGGNKKCSYILEVTLEDSKVMDIPQVKKTPRAPKAVRPSPSPAPREGNPSTTGL